MPPINFNHPVALIPPVPRTMDELRAYIKRYEKMTTDMVKSIEKEYAGETLEYRANLIRFPVERYQRVLDSDEFKEP